MDLTDIAGASGGLFDFTVSGIIASLLFSIIGWWMFRRGKKMTNIKVTLIGILLMTYTMFTHGIWDWLVGAGLCGLAYYVWED